MLQQLRRPIPATLLIFWAAAAAVGVALYCVAYTSLAGRPETFAEALAWSFSNLLPWLLAIELAKRAEAWTGAAAWLAAAGCLSVVLGYASSVNVDGLAFELIRRVPSLALSAALVTEIRSSFGEPSMCEDIQLLPGQIDWVRAAGNYIELRAGSRTYVQRMPIGEAERRLAQFGFIRIHRSTLVRRDRIARVRPEDVVLDDGTHLRIGKRYRALLDS